MYYTCLSSVEYLTVFALFYLVSTIRLEEKINICQAQIRIVDKRLPQNGSKEKQIFYFESKRH